MTGPKIVASLWCLYLAMLLDVYLLTHGFTGLAVVSPPLAKYGSWLFVSLFPLVLYAAAHYLMPDAPGPAKYGRLNPTSIWKSRIYTLSELPKPRVFAIIAAALFALPSVVLSGSIFTQGLWNHVTTRNDHWFVPRAAIPTPRASIEIYEDEGRYSLWQEKRLFPGLAVARRVARGIDSSKPPTVLFLDAETLEWQAGSAAPKRKSVAPSIFFGKLM
jgi:hypothetical protein